MIGFFHMKDITKNGSISRSMTLPHKESDFTNVPLEPRTSGREPVRALSSELLFPLAGGRTQPQTD